MAPITRQQSKSKAPAKKQKLKLPKEPELTIVETTTVSPDGKRQSLILPTLKKPGTYLKRGSRFFVDAQDPFVFDANQKYLQFSVRGIPKPQGRSAPMRYGNMVSTSKGDQNELASLIKNVMSRKIGRMPKCFFDDSDTVVRCIYAFPSREGQKTSALPDIDNLEKFLFDAFQTSGLISDDKNIRGMVHGKKCEHPVGSKTEKLAGTGGYFIVVKHDADFP